MPWFNDDYSDPTLDWRKVGLYERNRTEAFGAIRRAAVVARWNDYTPVGASPTEVAGDRIRDAIRAAIGSDTR